MNTDKAYILGLVIGGGGFSANLQDFYIERRQGSLINEQS